jgi:hypothetical protein
MDLFIFEQPTNDKDSLKNFENLFKYLANVVKFVISLDKFFSLHVLI